MRFLNIIWTLIFIVFMEPGPSIQHKKDCLIDVVFLVEESSLVSEAAYNKSLSIVQQTVANLDIKENGVNVGVSLYSNNYRKIFDLDYYLKKSIVINKVGEMKRNTNPGQPNIPNALNRSCKNMFLSSAGGRSLAANLLVVLSSSGKTNGTSVELQNAVQICKDNSVIIISVGENNSSNNIMEEMAFNPSYYFTLNDETVAMEISIVISDNGGCKEVVDRLEKWLEVIVFGSLALITFIMCLICFLQNLWLKRKQPLEEKEEKKENQKKKENQEKKHETKF